MKQTQALDILKAGRNVYLTGAAGSGKTHVLREYIEYLKNRGVGVALTASTGIAATHLGGVTIHSWSGIGIKDVLSEEDIDILIQKEYLHKRFRKTHVLIIDEVSMLAPLMFDSIDRLCRAMKQTSEPFGGMQIVLSGDFFQLPPITKGSEAVCYINTAEAWKDMDIRVCYLYEQHRHEDLKLESILSEMRGGKVSQETRALLLARDKRQFPQDVIPTRLYTHNADVDALNADELKKLPGKIYTYQMRTKGKNIMVESLKRGILAPEALELKKRAMVMFVKNNFEAGYVNGTLGVVKDFSDGMPVVRTFSGNIISVYPAEWVIEEGDKVLARAEQLPMRLAWAITVHKSQGMNMDAAEIDLSRAFVPGQGYVALSRLRTLSGLTLRGINEMALRVDEDVLKLDKELAADSAKLEKIVERFSYEAMEQMQNSFISKAGGTVDKKEIAKNKARQKDKCEDKIPTHKKTQALVERGLLLKEIAKERGMTTGTIIAHLEKIRAEDSNVNLDRFRPRAGDLEKITEAFAAAGETRLAPVYRKLKGRYTYDDLRLVRLFL